MQKSPYATSTRAALTLDSIFIRVVLPVMHEYVKRKVAEASHRKDYVSLRKAEEKYSIAEK